MLTDFHISVYTVSTSEYMCSPNYNTVIHDHNTHKQEILNSNNTMEC